MKWPLGHRPPIITQLLLKFSNRITESKPPKIPSQQSNMITRRNKIISLQRNEHKSYFIALISHGVNQSIDPSPSPVINSASEVQQPFWVSPVLVRDHRSTQRSTNHKASSKLRCCGPISVFAADLTKRRDRSLFGYRAKIIALRHDRSVYIFTTSHILIMR